MSKGKPIPIRFSPEEEKVIGDISARTGLNKSEIVRRAVRLLNREVDLRNDARFILDLITTQVPLPSAAPATNPPPRVNYLNEMPRQKSPFDSPRAEGA